MSQTVARLKTVWNPTGLGNLSKAGFGFGGCYILSPSLIHLNILLLSPVLYLYRIQNLGSKILDQKSPRERSYPQSVSSVSSPVWAGLAEVGAQLILSVCIDY